MVSYFLVIQVISIYQVHNIFKEFKNRLKDGLTIMVVKCDNQKIHEHNYIWEYDLTKMKI